MNAFIITNDSEIRTLVSRLCAAKTPVINVLPTLPSMNKDILSAMTAQPDLVIIDASGFDDAAAGMLSRMADKFPQAAIILLSSDRSPEYLISAMRAGVREVLSLPLVAEDLGAAMDRLSQKIIATQQIEGRVMSFVSAKGGAGTTFIAANLGNALSVLGRRRVLLLDFNVAFGDAALYVSDIRPVRTLADVCRDINRLDINLLESSIIRISPAFGILAAPPEPNSNEDLNPDHIETIIQLARRYYDFVIIDLGHQVNSVSVRALDNSDTIMLVMQQSLPDLRGARHMLEIFNSLGYRSEKIHLLLNRFESSAVLTVSEIERVIGQRIESRIPNNFDVANESINQGTPVLQLARSSSISKSLADWVGNLVDTASPAKSGIMRRIFVRNTDSAIESRSSR
jgi:pilus assembly protein CpaE